MKLYITKSVKLFFISLNIITYNVGALNSSDFAIICAAPWGTGMTPPPQCTALSSTYYNIDMLAGIKQVKGTLPVMVVDNRFYPAEWGDIVRGDNAKAYVKELADFEVSIVALDLMMHRIRRHYYNDPEFSSYIIKFIKSIKKELPDIRIGIAFRSAEDPMTYSIDVKTLNSEVDFYLLKCIEYRTCIPDEIHVATTDDIISHISFFRSCGMDTDKLIYTIDFTIITYKQLPLLDKGDDEFISFSDLCSKEVSKNRKFCFNSIPDLCNKAKLRRKGNHLGIYIDSCNYDDYNGSCLCAGADGNPIKFKGITVIAGADSDDKATVESFLCSTEYPIIKRT